MVLGQPTDGSWAASPPGSPAYFALDVAHVRIILVALSFLAGAAIPLYLAAWVLIPAEGSDTAIADEVLNHAGSHSS